jgi:hypothetical protein
LPVALIGWRSVDPVSSAFSVSCGAPWQYDDPATIWVIESKEKAEVSSPPWSSSPRSFTGTGSSP